MYSFLKFLEDIENNSLSPPQHKKGEESLDIKDLLKKRILEMTNELEVKGKGTRDEILKSLIDVINSLLGVSQNQNPQNSETEPSVNQNQSLN